MDVKTLPAKIGQLTLENEYGRQFVIPVQAKGGSDKHGAMQTHQDIACCAEKFPTLICRAISAQFMSDDKIALFELTVEDGNIKVVEERHYQLVPAADISAGGLKAYSRRRT